MNSKLLIGLVLLGLFAVSISIAYPALADDGIVDGDATCDGNGPHGPHGPHGDGIGGGNGHQYHGAGPHGDGTGDCDGTGIPVPPA